MRINTSLKGSSKYQDDAQRAFAYAEILQDYSDDIWTRITVEKNRITVKCMVDHTATKEIHRHRSAARFPRQERVAHRLHGQWVLVARALRPR